MCDTEKIAQDIIDKNLFSWLEFPDYFSLTFNKRLLSDDEEIMSLDDTSLFTSKTADFLNTKEKLECKINKQTASKLATIESAEGQSETSAPHKCQLLRLDR